MNFIVTVFHFVVSLSLMLAPKGADRITITGPSPAESIEISRTAEDGWRSRLKRVSFSDGILSIEGSDIPLNSRDRGFLATAAANDWLKTPTLVLDAITSLEKSPDGFILHLKEGDQTKEYRIRYHQAAAGKISVNVLGEVNQPGVYQIPEDGSLRDAIAAAGEVKPGAALKRTSIVRGAAGTTPKVTFHDLAAIRKGEAASPRIEAGDTIHVPALNGENSEPPGGPEMIVRAQHWLAGIDAGNYAQSWKDAAMFFQKAITEAAWSDALTKVRQPLGALKSRKLLSAQNANSLPGAPDGAYVVMQFDTSFAAKEEAVETVTFMLEKDGTWRAVGYFIR